MEVGIGRGRRALRMIELATLHGPPEQIRYVGVDLFEARQKAESPGLSLKGAYQLLRTTGARIQLLPGDPRSALSRAANTLTGVDLVVVSPQEDGLPLDALWFYLPRMLHEAATVLVQHAGPGGPMAVRRLTARDIARLGGDQMRRRAA